MARKPRPLVRDKLTYRDDRLILIASDDRYAPKQYFDLFELRRVKVYVVETSDGTSSSNHALDRLLSINCEPDDERWLVLDTDHVISGSHLPTLVNSLQRARQSRINIAMSRPCFEMWLLLHHLEPAAIDVTNAADVERLLRATLGAYNKTRLNAKDYSADGLVAAITRAIEMDTSPTSEIPPANATRIYLIWRSIFEIVGIADLPDPLKILARDLGF